tara:strand:- start:116 stop:292 length:177 start_codon:yes stop_codon:yes gene_type:complete
MTVFINKLITTERFVNGDIRDVINDIIRACQNIDHKDTIIELKLKSIESTVNKLPPPE